MSEPKMTIRDASMLRCPTCSGSGLVPRHTHKELDRLRAENERLATETTQAAQRNLDLRVENDRLRAENAAKTEALDRILAEHAKVGPELDRLRAENAKLKDTIQFVRTFVEGRAILAKTAKEGE